MINKSFSKGDMIEIIRTFNIDIPNFASMDKTSLSMKLWAELCSLESIPIDNDIFDIKNIEELKHYLMNKNPNKTLSVKDKSKLMKFCKEVINYCNNGYEFERSIFNDFFEIEIQMKDIAVHGDIPSVRRAIKLFNEDPKLKEKIQPVISNKVKKELNNKKQGKKKNTYCFTRKTGLFIVTFD